MTRTSSSKFDHCCPSVWRFGVWSWVTRSSEPGSKRAQEASRFPDSDRSGRLRALMYQDIPVFAHLVDRVGIGLRNASAVSDAIDERLRPPRSANVKGTDEMLERGLELGKQADDVGALQMQ